MSPPVFLSPGTPLLRTAFLHALQRHRAKQHCFLPPLFTCSHMMDENESIGLAISNVLGHRSSCHSIMEAEMIVLHIISLSCWQEYFGENASSRILYNVILCCSFCPERTKPDGLHLLKPLIKSLRNAIGEHSPHDPVPTGSTEINTL